MEILYNLMEFVVNKENIPVLVVGDLNMVLNRTMDRFPPGARSRGEGEGHLNQFLKEVGWWDIWRVKHPDLRQYSCFSSTYSTLSRIDMALGNGACLQVVSKISYYPRGVSDHSPLVLSLNTGKKCPLSNWKISPFWLEVMGKPEEISIRLRELLDFNTGTAPEGVVWDALKAFLRGILIQQVAKIKRNSREWEEKIREEVLEAEKQYVENPTLSKQRL